MSVFLVRHGRPTIVRDLPAPEWELDPAGYDDVWALRDRLPVGAAWYSSPEPKALQTAQLLTDTEVGVVGGLREMVRDGIDWIEPFEPVIARAFEAPTLSAYPGWESLATVATRVVAAVEPILAAHSGEDVVLVGHGTAWTVLVAELRGTPPDLEAWRRLAMPDLIVVEPEE